MVKLELPINGKPAGVNADDPQMPRRYALHNECRLARADRPRERRWGASDPTVAVVPSAIANAAYDALGSG